jgi:hypothetical protein
LRAGDGLTLGSASFDHLVLSVDNPPAFINPGLGDGNSLCKRQPW